MTIIDFRKLVEEYFNQMNISINIDDEILESCYEDIIPFDEPFDEDYIYALEAYIVAIYLVMKEKEKIMKKLT